MVHALIDKMLSGDRAALARLISLVEKGSPEVPELMSKVHPYIGKAYCLGITGPPGAGKSTLVDLLAELWRKENLSVGILAADPSSPFSGGAILGDRIRMQQHYLDQGVFIRSMATRGNPGGLPRVASGAVKLLDAFGSDVIIVETVGVGQTELDIVQLADTVVVVLVPESGDSIQVMKAGLLEIADILVVNKADREGASQMVTNLKTMLAMGERDSRRRPPILSCQAHKGEGARELLEEIKRHKSFLESDGRLEEKRKDRRKREFLRAIEERMRMRLNRVAHQGGDEGTLLHQVESGEVDPYFAAAHFVEESPDFREWLSSLNASS